MPVVTQKHWDSIFGADKKLLPKIKSPKLVKEKEDCSPSGG